MSWRRGLRVTAGILACAVLGWGVGLLAFAARLPLAPETPAASASRTDAIIVLTGTGTRIRRGITLLQAGAAGKLFISGVDAQVALDDVLRSGGVAADLGACCIMLGYDARNTHGNAWETAAWARRQGVNSIRLVTSWYHMPRSLLEFSRTMPDATIIADPVFPETAKPRRWWLQSATITLLVGEYDKYLAVLGRPLYASLLPQRWIAAAGAM